MSKRVECHIRIKQAMELRNITQAEIVEKTDIKKSAMSQYLSGKIKPRQNAISELSRVLNVSEPWLMGYEVPMERNPKIPSPKEDPYFVDTSMLTPDELEEFNKVTGVNKQLFFNEVDEEHDMALFKQSVVDILIKLRDKKKKK